MLGINPVMLAMARASRGLTQTALAEKIGATPPSISQIETGLRPASETVLAKLSEVLQYPLGFFELPGRWHGTIHRQQATTKEWMPIEAKFQIIACHVDMMSDGKSGCRIQPIRDWEGKPEKAAEFLRRLLVLPRGPIKNLTHTIEQGGTAVYNSGIEAKNIKSLTLYTRQQRPIVYLNQQRPEDMRFALTHEVGHILLHVVAGKDEEREARAFAYAFLMPRDDIRDDLLVLRRKAKISFKMRLLLGLQRYWGVSTNNIVDRAKMLQIIDKATRQQLKIALRRYYGKESSGIEQEEPVAIRDMIAAYAARNRIAPADLPAILGLYPDEFFAYYGNCASGLRVLR